MAFSYARANQEKRAEVPTPALVFSPLPDPVKGRLFIVRSPPLSNCGDGHHHNDPLMNP